MTEDLDFKVVGTSVKTSLGLCLILNDITKALDTLAESFGELLLQSPKR
jgi:hypothetical protein